MQLTNQLSNQLIDWLVNFKLDVLLIQFSNLHISRFINVALLIKELKLLYSDGIMNYGFFIMYVTS